MQFCGLRAEEKITHIYYKSTWDYDFPYALLFLQQLIDEDFHRQITYAEAGDFDQTYDFQDELERVRGKLRNCRTLMREKTLLSIAGFSEAMDCDLRVTLFPGTNHVQIEIMDRADMFTEHGEHIFDVYMDSFEILAYIAAAKADGGK